MKIVCSARERDPVMAEDGRVRAPLGILLAVVGLALGGLGVGFVPVGVDPDLMYKPIKAELARALARGQLPFWTDRLGLGVPLAAESHLAAFYPVNLVAYGLFDVETAYRGIMWLSFVALALATFAYARDLGQSAWGAAVAGLSFSLGCFAAAHAVHEPLYNALPYLPLALLAAHCYARGGNAGWLAALALILGIQVLVGHFHIQALTCVLVFVLGAWTVLAEGRPRRRILMLLAGLAWGLGVAALQLVATWELVQVSEFHRPLQTLAMFSLLPEQWAQLALPRLFMDFPGGTVDPYWIDRDTSTGEACFYVGTVPLLLAFIGGAGSRNRALRPWLLLIPVSFVLACLPRLAPGMYATLARLPGFGTFRASARFTLVTTLGLSLLAGAGLDRALEARRFRLGVLLALAFGAAAFAFGIAWARGPEVLARLGEARLRAHVVEAAVAWGIALAALITWRAGRAGPWLPFGVTALELVFLFYHGPASWGWAGPGAAESPTLRRLAAEPGVRLVAGQLDNLPVLAGLTPAYPYIAITPPRPNHIFDLARRPRKFAVPEVARWFRRVGVTHAVWDGTQPVFGGELLAEGADPVLDRLTYKKPGPPPPQRWRIVRYPGIAPAAVAARREAVASSFDEVLAVLSASDDTDVAYYLPGDRPPPSKSPRARSARVVSEGLETLAVEHDGACDLVVARTYYPGWFASVDDAPEQPVLRANGGLQAVRLDGSGTHRVSFRYRPRYLVVSLAVSAVCAVSAAGCIAGAWLRRRRTATPERDDAGRRQHLVGADPLVHRS
ncbi:MAG: hypothetical protein P4L84_19780 [Isosphaeraceae bacterium]|nr:hypothetical protein [Isosphaeraceae bacterium]